MAKHGLVSFIMPVWRPKPDWLRDAIKSVLAQRDCELELIIVDDGNPTPVHDLLGWLDDPRVRLLRAEHGGPSNARNLGIAAAKGSQFRFVDADDVLEAGSTARLQKLIGGADDVIAYGTTLSCDEQLRPIARRYESTLEGDVSQRCLLGEFDVRHFSMLFPRAIVETIGEWSLDFPVSSDRDFIQRATEHGRVRGERAIASYYRRHALSIQGQADIASGEAAALKVIACYIQRHPEKHGSKLHRRAIANTLLNRAKAYEDVGSYAVAFSRLAKAAPYAPRLASRAAAGMMWRRVRCLMD
ncbi:MAG TPA: glycosyltransferase [Sphingomicrobium sp.]|nr:glycosyltransferase [Sphingomicrobium sp.]